LSNPVVNRILYAAAVVANLALGAFSVQLAAGAVPLPAGWSWAIPILQAAITGLLMFLPREGSYGIASQVDALKARGVHREDMVVLEQNEAVRAVVDDPAAIRDSALVRAVADEIEARLRAMPPRGDG
jgi:hypothetical protein